MRRRASEPQAPDVPPEAELELSDVELPEHDAAGGRFASVRLTNVDLAAARLDGVRVVDAELASCNLSNARCGNADVTRLAIQGSRLTGIALSESVRFHRCDLTCASFRGAQLGRCEFRRCDLTGLQGADGLRGAAMEWPDIVEMAGVWAGALGIEVLEDD